MKDIKLLKKLGEWLFGPFDDNFEEAMEEVGFTTNKWDKEKCPTCLKVSCMCYEDKLERES